MAGGQWEVVGRKAKKNKFKAQNKSKKVEKSNGVSNFAVADCYKMSSTGILRSHNGTLESLEDSSFIIIDQPGQSMVNGNIFEVGPPQRSFDLTNLHSALMSASPEISLDKLQSHLADAVEDNIALREALAINNVRMEEQLKTITSWHNKITPMSEQQLNLREAQEKIETLEKENVELHHKVKELETKPVMVDCETEVSMKNTISPLSDEEVDFEIVNRKELKNRVDENKVKDKISDMAKIIEEQNKQIADLKKHIENNPKDRELLEGQQKITALNLLIQELQEKICTLENSLQMKESELEEEKTCHLETKKMFTLVQTNYDRVTKLLQIQSKDDKGKNDEEERERDTRMYLEQIDNVTAKLLDTEDKLHEREEKVNTLIAELNALKEDSENIPILKAQLEVYKIDLSSACLARDAALEDVSRLTKEKHENSFVSLCDSCGGNISLIEGGSRPKSKKKTSPSSKKLEVKQKGDLLICPICNQSFWSLDALESHVNDCIDHSERSSNQKQ